MPRFNNRVMILYRLISASRDGVESPLGAANNDAWSHPVRSRDDLCFSNSECACRLSTENNHTGISRQAECFYSACCGSPSVSDDLPAPLRSIASQVPANDLKSVLVIVDGLGCPLIPCWMIEAQQQLPSGAAVALQRTTRLLQALEPESTWPEQRWPSLPHPTRGSAPAIWGECHTRSIDLPSAKKFVFQTFGVMCGTFRSTVPVRSPASHPLATAIYSPGSSLSLLSR